MRRLALTALTLMTLATPSMAQDIQMPTLTFPQPGTFCGPFQLCEPMVTRTAQN